MGFTQSCVSWLNLSNSYEYKSSRAAEDQAYELVNQCRADQFHGLGNGVRRSSAAVPHHIMSTYRLKLAVLTAMRREAELTQKHFEEAHSMGATDELMNEDIRVIKQFWGSPNGLRLSSSRSRRRLNWPPKKSW